MLAIKRLLRLKDPRRYGAIECDNEIARAMQRVDRDHADSEVYGELLRLIELTIAQNRCESIKQALRSCRSQGQYQILQDATNLVGSWSTSFSESGDPVCYCTFAMAITVQNCKGQHYCEAPAKAHVDRQRIDDLLAGTSLATNSDMEVLPVLVDPDAASKLTLFEWSSHAKNRTVSERRPKTAMPEHSPFRPLIGYDPQLKLLLGTVNAREPLWNRFPAHDDQLGEALTAVCAASLDPSGETFVRVGCPRPILNAINAAQQMWNLSKWCAFDARVSDTRRFYIPEFQALPMFDGRGMIVVSAQGEKFSWLLDQGEAWQDEIEILTQAIKSLYG